MRARLLQRLLPASQPSIPASATHPGPTCASSSPWLPSRAWSSQAADADAATARPWSQPSLTVQLNRVVVTGLGLVTPLGVGVQPSWDALLQGKTGVRALREEDLPPSHRPLLPQLPCRVAALVPRESLSAALDKLNEDARRSSQFMLYGLLAADEALRDAQWQPSTHEERVRTGVSVGSGMSSCGEIGDAWTELAAGRLRRMSPFFVPRILPNMAAGAIGIRWQLNGPNYSASTACATGVHTIGDAYRLIQRGEADVMVAGAAEACVDAISLAGFSRLKALSTHFNDQPSLASRPFDSQRDGFVMGEGAGVVVLESLTHAMKRGAPQIYAEVRGYGLSGDGHHITQPHPQGLGGRLCMQRALQGSGLDRTHVCYVNAHATSTPQGDETEARSIAELWGAEPVRSLAVSSTKGATGHLLGAAGAVETVFTILALHHRQAPPTANLTHPSPPDILPGLVGPQPVALPPKDTPAAAMCNSFGFGGTNASLLVASVAD